MRVVAGIMGGGLAGVGAGHLAMVYLHCGMLVAGLVALAGGIIVGFAMGED